MEARDGHKVSEGAEVKAMTPDAGQQAADEAEQYRKDNAEKEREAEKERDIRYGRVQPPKDKPKKGGKN